MKQSAAQAHAREIVAAGAQDLGLPAGYARLRAIIEDPNGSSLQMCEAFAHHPTLGQALLHLLEGPLHSARGASWTPLRAVNQLGMQRVLDLSLIALLPIALERLASAAGRCGFWPLAVRCGLAARAIAEHAGRSERDRMWCAGTLAPAGLLLMWHVQAESMQRVHDGAAAGGDQRQIERAHAGTDHLAVAAALARHWQLPLPIIRSLAASGRPAQAVPHHTEAAVVALAMRVAGLPGHAAAPLEVPLDLLGLDAAQLEAAAAQARELEAAYLTRLLER